MADPKLKLTPLERDSAVWRKIKKYVEDRLVEMRERNDGNHSDIKTAQLRGRIAELKNLAGLDAPAPETEADDDIFNIG